MSKVTPTVMICNLCNKPSYKMKEDLYYVEIYICDDCTRTKKPIRRVDEKS